MDERASETDQNRRIWTLKKEFRQKKKVSIQMRYSNRSHESTIYLGTYIRLSSIHTISTLCQTLHEKIKKKRTYTGNDIPPITACINNIPNFFPGIFPLFYNLSLCVHTLDWNGLSETLLGSCRRVLVLTHRPALYTLLARWMKETANKKLLKKNCDVRCS